MESSSSTGPTLKQVVAGHAGHELDFVAFNWKSVFAAETLQSNYVLYKINRMASKYQLLLCDKTYKVFSFA
jgi:hypothetical protein